MVAELIEQCVAGNDRVAPDQTEYRKKCDGLAGCRRLLFSLVFYGIFLQFAFSLGQNQNVYQIGALYSTKPFTPAHRSWFDIFIISSRGIFFPSATHWLYISTVEVCMKCSRIFCFGGSRSWSHAEFFQVEFITLLIILLRIYP